MARNQKYNHSNNDIYKYYCKVLSYRYYLKKKTLTLSTFKFLNKGYPLNICKFHILLINKMKACLSKSLNIYRLLRIYYLEIIKGYINFIFIFGIFNINNYININFNF